MPSSPRHTLLLGVGLFPALMLVVYLAYLGYDRTAHPGLLVEWLSSMSPQRLALTIMLISGVCQGVLAPAST